ncbi:MAG: hypothetical protein WC489_02930 [Patescibacteria group bacterium]
MKQTKKSVDANKQFPSFIKKGLSKLPKNRLIPLVIIVLLIGVFIGLRFFKSGPDLNKMKTQIIPEVVKKVVNNPSTKIEVLSAKEVDGVIQFELSVDGQKYVSYISRGGKILFTSGILLEDLNKQQEAASSSSVKPLTCDEIQKADTANLTAFVVADCPYGLQMQRVLKKATSELPALGQNISVKYIGAVEDGKITSMHGDSEAQENLRQICVREEQSNLYWPYVSCYMQEGKSEECLTATGVNTAELASCVKDAGRGIAYAKQDFDLANKYKITGSPTLLINGKQTVSEFDFGGRNSDAMKQLVCCGSTEKPDFCSSELTKTDVAVSYSVTDEAAAGSGSTDAANCN